MHPDWLTHNTPLARLQTQGGWSVHAVHPAHAGRSALEQFIRLRFAERYQASIRHFMPSLLSLQDNEGQLRGGVGLRLAHEQALFLERYLDQPIEQAISAQAGADVPRRSIVEVGNLAASSAGAARLLIVALTDLLVSQGACWVVFTGTHTLLNSFHRLGLSPCQLASADPARMGSELADWGSYYSSQPQVMAGHILGGHRDLWRQGLYARLGYQSLLSPEDLDHIASH